MTKTQKKQKKNSTSTVEPIRRMFPVEDSSIIDSIGYDYRIETLHVKFKSNGAMYAYENVTPLHWAQLCNHVSVGEAFSVIKKHKEQFPYKKL